MKKSLVLVAMLAIALAACGKKKKQNLLKLLLLTLRSNLLHEHLTYLDSCSIKMVNSCNPAGVFSGLPSVSCT